MFVWLTFVVIANDRVLSFCPANHKALHGVVPGTAALAAVAVNWALRGWASPPMGSVLGFEDFSIWRDSRSLRDLEDGASAEV